MGFKFLMVTIDPMIDDMLLDNIIFNQKKWLLDGDNPRLACKSCQTNFCVVTWRHLLVGHKTTHPGN